MSPKSLLVAVLLAGVAAVLIARSTADGGEWGWGLVTRVKGTVETRRMNESRWSKVFASRLLLLGDWVRVREGSLANVRLADETVIKLGPRTVTRIDDVVGPDPRPNVLWSLFAGKTRWERAVEAGKVTANFTLSSPTGVMAVREVKKRLTNCGAVPESGSDPVTSGRGTCPIDAEIEVPPDVYENTLVAGGALGTITLSTGGGTPFRTLTVPGYVSGTSLFPTIDFSPDGRRLAFIMTEPGLPIDTPQVYVMTIDGRGLTRVTSYPANTFDRTQTLDSPVWSPDGTQIAYTGVTFTSDPDHPVEKAGVYVVSIPGASGLSGEATTPGTGYSYDGDSWLYVHGVDWSVDGRLAFICRSGNQICVDGKPVYTAPTEDRYAVVAPSWSPDGTQIAFGRWEDTDTRWSVRTIDADGKNDTELWTGQAINSGFHIAWSPDGGVSAWCGYCSGRQVLGWSPFLRTIVRVNQGAVEVRPRDDLAAGTAGAAAAGGKMVVVKAGQEVTVDARENGGLPQKPVSFDVPPALKLVAPPDGSSQSAAPTLDWEAFPGTDHYVISFLGPASRSHPGPIATGWVSGKRTEVSLARDWRKMARGDWRWRVEAVDAEGKVLAASAWWRFTRR